MNTPVSSSIEATVATCVCPGAQVGTCMHLDPGLFLYWVRDPKIRESRLRLQPSIQAYIFMLSRTSALYYSAISLLYHEWALPLNNITVHMF